MPASTDEDHVARLEFVQRGRCFEQPHDLRPRNHSQKAQIGAGKCVAKMRRDGCIADLAFGGSDGQRHGLAARSVHRGNRAGRWRRRPLEFTGCPAIRVIESPGCRAPDIGQIGPGKQGGVRHPRESMVPGRPVQTADPRQAGAAPCRRVPGRCGRGVEGLLRAVGVLVRRWRRAFPRAVRATLSGIRLKSPPISLPS